MATFARVYLCDVPVRHGLTSRLATGVATGDAIMGFT